MHDHSVAIDVEFSRIQDQVHRVLTSKSFHTCEALRNLLAYLLDFTSRHPNEPVKAREVAMAVFGRDVSFDSQTDSVVRVHVGRLRSRLAEYYLDEGRNDVLIIEIPKGSYSLCARFRELTGHLEPVTEISPPTSALLPASRMRFRLPVRAVWILATLSVTVALIASFRPRLLSGPQADPALALWRSITDPKAPVLIVFSNFLLLGSPSTGLAPAKSDTHPASVVDTYTSMGEVLGVFQTTRILTQLAQPVVAKRGRLTTWDDAKDRNLVFIGSTFASTPLLDIPASGNLQFVSQPGLPNAILNVHAQKGELEYYVGPGLTAHPAWDYAVVSLRPGLSTEHRLLVLAGITEFGTEAAAEFATRPDCVRRLFSALKLPVGTKEIPNFDAIIRVTLSRDVPLAEDLVLAHSSP